jgi:hypothetical protein
MNIKKTLKEFLENKGILDIYIENVTTQDNKINVNYINKAFFWEETPQGYSYWENINEEYNNLLKKETMTADENRTYIKRNWEFLEAFKNGSDIEELINGEWITSNSPAFNKPRNYRIKKFKPVNGDVILALIENKWKKRIFVKMDREAYLCIFSESDDLLITTPLSFFLSNNVKACE